MSKDQGSNSFANERTNKYAYQNDTMQFDDLSTLYKKNKRENSSFENTIIKPNAMTLYLQQLQHPLTLQKQEVPCRNH